MSAHEYCVKNRNPDITYPGARAIGEANFTKLKVLTIGCNNLYDPGVRAILGTEKFPNLEKMDLQDCKNTSCSLKILKSQFQNLKILNLTISPARVT